MKNRNDLNSWYFASCPTGLDLELETELKNHNITEYTIKKGGISFSIDDELSALKFLLQTRITSRMYKEVHSFPMKTQEDLYKKANAKWWHKVFKKDQTFKIETLFDQNAKKIFSNSMYISLKLKDAIVDQFMEALGERPSVDLKFPDLRFLLRIEQHPNANKGFMAYILLDLSGKNPLCNRGYRISGHIAPLRENLAAGIIKKTDWNPDEDLFIDPMCGSGTFLIEAILIKGNISPSYLKLKRWLEDDESPFSFLNQIWFASNKRLETTFISLCKKLWTKSKNSLERLPSHQFYGGDLSIEALNAANENLRAALISPEVLSLKKASATQFLPPGQGPGVILCNPPYGKRMGDVEHLKPLYHDFGENLKTNYMGFRAYIFTSNPELRKEISLQTKERSSLYNGAIECRLLKYDLY